MEGRGGSQFQCLCVACQGAPCQEFVFRGGGASLSQVVLGIFGMYVGVYGVFKLVSGGGKKEAAPAPVAAAVSSNDDVPSITSAGFDDWIKIPGNMEKYEQAVEKSLA